MVNSSSKKDQRSQNDPRFTSETLELTRFPESFQRCAAQYHDRTLDSDLSITPLHSSLSPRPLDDERRTSDPTPPIRIRNNSAMRLENLLNDVPFEDVPTRSRSLEARSTEQEPLELETSIASPSSVEESTVKKKKVKMHYCQDCQKGFPRPSGLRTHMSVHTNERPYLCEYPGCARAFSVVSNVKRHMKTHGMGITGAAPGPGADRYVVGFEDPVILEPSGSKAKLADKEPMRLRWMSSAAETGRTKRSSVDFESNFISEYNSPDPTG